MDIFHVNSKKKKKKKKTKRGFCNIYKDVYSIFMQIKWKISETKAARTENFNRKFYGNSFFSLHP